MQGLFARCVRVLQYQLESRLKAGLCKGLFARCVRVLQYELKSRLKASLCKACLPDASGSFKAA